MKEKIISYIKLIICFGLFLYSSTIISFGLSLIGIDITNMNVFTKTLFSVSISLILAVIIILIYRKEIVKDFKEFKINFSNRLLFTLKLFGIFMLIKIMSSYVSVILSNVLNIQELTSENQSTITDLLGQYPLLMIFSSVCLAPIYEEILFRLGFKKCIKNNVLFVLISGTLFGLIHIFPTDLSISIALIQSIVYVVMGISLAYFYQKYDNIFYSIILHFYNNLFSIIVLLLSFIGK